MPRLFGGLVSLMLVAGAAAEASVTDEAYERNREGMVAMAEARFVDAIEAFEDAAKLVPDYGINGRPLMYTPIFMQGWASEKIGREASACRAYREFLRIAREHPVEPTKVDHATAYVGERCRNGGAPR